MRHGFPSPRWRLTFAIGALFGVTLTAGWHAFARPWAEDEASERLGHRVTIGGLLPTLGGLAATDVIVYGRAPFDREPLAFIERMSWSAARGLSVDGMDVQILATTGADNVRGRHTHGKARTRRLDATTRGAGMGGLKVRRARASGLVQLPGGQRVAMRAAHIELDAPAGGAAAARLKGLALDWLGGATFTLSAVDVHATAPAPAGRELVVEGKGFSMALPGTRQVLSALMIDGTASARGFSLSARSSRGATGPVSASVRSNERGIELWLEAAEVPLAPLGSWLASHGLVVDEARGHLQASASWTPGQRQIPWTLEMGARGLTVRHPSFDVEPWVGVPVDARLVGTVDLDQDRVLLGESTVEMFRVPLRVSGVADLALRPRGRLAIASPRGGLGCDDLLERQPPSVKRALEGMRLGGRLELAVQIAFDARNWDDVGLDIAMPRLCKVVAEPGVLARDLPVLVGAQPGRLGGRPDLPVSTADARFVPFARVPPHLVAAFVTAEDSTFFEHNGFRVDGIRRALAYNLERGILVRGASTITQQLAKNLFLEPDRTLSRKLAETVLTWRLDTLVSKRRALEVYLNMIELGPGIHGVSEAAKRYFGKTLDALGPLEAAHLASLPPNPKGFARRFRDGRVDDGWLHRLYDLLGMMNRRGQLSAPDLAAARGAGLRLRKI
jgi:monofunctional biosynthetic peptidoglycan transglycosylase